MAELNLKQIIDRLNAEFSGDTRKLVFWYDDKAEFEEDMQGVMLENAKVYYLQRDNQFYTKYFLERVDTATNYLIYAPFPKPEAADNHLEDTLLYSKRFFANRAALLLADLGIDEKYRPLIEKHIKFWAEKKRAQRFYDLEIENYNEANILVGIMAALCSVRTCSFEDVVRVVLTGGGLADNSFMAEFERYDLLDAFWKFCEQHFGYTDVKPTLEKLTVTMFVTYTAKYIGAELPKPWKVFQSYKSGNIIAFLDNLMNSVIYRETYDALSAHVAKGLNAGTVFAGYLPEDLAGCDTFLCIDQILIKWMTDRLLNEDIGAKLGTLTIPQVCEKRQKMHFGPQMEQSYSLLDSAYHLITAAAYHCPDGFKAIVDKYRNTDCQIDSAYRWFYFAYDQLADTADFETLRELAENIYTNEFLAKLLPKWNAGLADGDSLTSIPAQVDFFSRHIKNAKDRVVIIISDALRFEVGRELFQRMQDAPKCVSAKLEIQLGVLPSYTRLGMAALLPHKSLTMTDDYQVLVDDVLCDSLAGREKVLQSYVPGSVCVQFDDMKALKKMELREIITGKQVVYIYHNQIDARGDKLNTENEVFSACQEAIQEIIDLIHRIAVGANTIHFIVTADHGFIYKRDKVTESGKMGGVSDKGAFVNRRFIVSSVPVVDMEDLKAGRKAFTKDEWIDVLLRSIGMEPDKLEERVKWLLLARMLPLVENNFNLCELGPRSTGKSHLYKEISPNSILVSGGQTTVANLFYNMGRKTVGLVGLWDCVAFDEVAGINFKDKDGIQIMKDYMASGSFARGKEEKAASASMVFVGNINQSVDVLLKTSSLFDPFPLEMGTDTAFLDRMHCYLPGWEIPKFRPGHFTNDYGFITDYLAEFLRELRKEQYGDALDKHFRLGKNLNQRDTIAVRKIVGGLLKLVYPDGEFSKEELEEILAISLEMRRRVKEQLKKLGGMEFYDVNFSYIDNDTFEEHYVSVPEQGGGKLIPEGICNPGQVYTVGYGKSGMIGVFCLESQMLPGNGKFERTGIGSDRDCREAANTAFNFLKANANRISGTISTTTKDYIVNYQDLQGIGMTSRLALPTLIAICSIALGKPTLSSLAVLGEISISGTMIKVEELANALQVCVDSGAKKVLLPMTSAVDLATVPADLISSFNLIFYNSAEDAVFKALGVEKSVRLVTRNNFLKTQCQKEKSRWSDVNSGSLIFSEKLSLTNGILVHNAYGFACPAAWTGIYLMTFYVE